MQRVIAYSDLGTQSSRDLLLRRSQYVLMDSTAVKQYVHREHGKDDEKQQNA